MPAQWERTLSRLQQSPALLLHFVCRVQKLLGDSCVEHIMFDCCLTPVKWFDLPTVLWSHALTYLSAFDWPQLRSVCKRLNHYSRLPQSNSGPFEGRGLPPKHVWPQLKLTQTVRIDDWASEMSPLAPFPQLRMLEIVAHGNGGPVEFETHAAVAFQEGTYQISVNGGLGHHGLGVMPLGRLITLNELEITPTVFPVFVRALPNMVNLRRLRVKWIGSPSRIDLGELLPPGALPSLTWLSVDHVIITKDYSFPNSLTSLELGYAHCDRRQALLAANLRTFDADGTTSVYVVEYLPSTITSLRLVALETELSKFPNLQVIQVLDRVNESILSIPTVAPLQEFDIQATQSIALSLTCRFATTLRRVMWRLSGVLPPDALQCFATVPQLQRLQLVFGEGNKFAPGQCAVLRSCLHLGSFTVAACYRATRSQLDLWKATIDDLLPGVRVEVTEMQLQEQTFELD